MKKIYLILIISSFTLYLYSSADETCGFEGDVLGNCVFFRKCPQNRIKNLTFVPQGSINAYKVPKRCSISTHVCCDSIEPLNTAERKNPEGCNNGKQFGICKPSCENKETILSKSNCVGSLLCCEAKKSSECPGTCLKECPLNWTTEGSLETTTTENVPNFGAFVIEEKFSTDEVLCKVNDEKCCIPPHNQQVEQPNRVDQPNLNKCGRHNPSINNRIGGGEDAEFAEFPWLVVIAKKIILSENVTGTVYQGTGSLISPTIILTAAHKVVNIEDISDLIVRAGDHDVSKIGEPLPHQEIYVQKIIIHEDFYRPTHLNNVALVIVKEPFTLTDNIGTLCLPQPEMIDYLSGCIIAGWGANGSMISPTVNYQRVLKKAKINLVENEKCERQLRQTKLGEHFNLHNSFVCAIGEKGEDTCEGDGGAPLFCLMKNDNKRYFQMGITSWGIGCNNKEIPGVYVNVLKFTKWILDKKSLFESNIEEKISID